jgi:hypothetical protein
MRFNPPPNWPVGAGWTPDPGFVPDPSWPPAPAGWQFWVDDSPAVAAQSPGPQGVPADPGTAPTQHVPQYPGAPAPYPGIPQPGQPFGPPPNHTRRNVLIGVAVAVVLIAVAVGLFFVIRGSDSKSEKPPAQTSSTVQMSSRPKTDNAQIRAVVTQLESAWNASDFEAFMGHTCRAFASDTSHSESRFSADRSKNGKVSLKVTKVDVTGSTAVASVDRKYADESQASSVKLDFVKEDGEWKTCPQ